ncbi:phosphoribosyltransferase family protein [Capilliphycus salinus ALCB114379]|uniref:phosphoribosyltransferase family protein n=1 Tax=Capilliphycus salinus TaxID=2768948 RepID=UPI0039A6D19A
MIFKNRTEAGRRLAKDLKTYANRPDVIVLALPRGGVPVAFQVARELNAPLDVWLVRKLGVPGREELASGGDRQWENPHFKRGSVAIAEYIRRRH